MRIITFLITLSFIFHLSGQKKPIDVYLIGGQSNATGQGYMVNIPEEFSIDSTNLYAQWNPGNNNKDEHGFGPEYEEFIRTVEMAIKGLRAFGYEPAIRAMVWQQGEGDARDIAGMENSNNYGKNLRHFIQRVREQFSTPDMLFIYGYVIPVPLERFSGREEVRSSQQHVDQGSGHPLALNGAFVVETDDLPLRCDEPNSPYPADSVHFNTYGIIEFGNRFARKIMENTKI